MRIRLSLTLDLDRAAQPTPEHREVDIAGTQTERLVEEPEFPYEEDKRVGFRI